MKYPRVALVYDRVNKFGGAERVLLALNEIWPEAPLYTAVYSIKNAGWASGFEIKSSYLQKIPLMKNKHEWLAGLTPAAFGKFDLSRFDIVISITSAEAKHVKTNPQTLHICYCLTPTRYLWSHKNFYERNGLKGLFLKIMGPSLRARDWQASQGVDHFIAISNEVKNRIAKYYGRPASVIYPPVAKTLQKPDLQVLPFDDFYLVVSRLVPYKRVDLAIKACQKLGRNLVIVGTGNEAKKLKKMADSQAHFTGYLTDQELARYYIQCCGLIFPGVEDFGIVPVEAQSYGKAVVAYQSGGALETVVADKTGIFFQKQNVASLVRALKKFEKTKFNKLKCKNQAKKFSKANFKNKFKKTVEVLWQKHQKKYQ